MDWSFVFGAVNMLALLAWVALVALPRWPALLSALTYFGVGLLCLVYAICLVGVLAGLIPAGEAGQISPRSKACDRFSRAMLA